MSFAGHAAWERWREERKAIEANRASSDDEMGQKFCIPVGHQFTEVETENSSYRLWACNDCDVLELLHSKTAGGFWTNPILLHLLWGFAAVGSEFGGEVLCETPFHKWWICLLKVGKIQNYFYNFFHLEHVFRNITFYLLFKKLIFYNFKIRNYFAIKITFNNYSQIPQFFTFIFWNWVLIYYFIAISSKEVVIVIW